MSSKVLLCLIISEARENTTANFGLKFPVVPSRFSAPVTQRPAVTGAVQHPAHHQAGKEAK